MAVLIVASDFDMPPDEGGTIQTDRFIKSFKSEKKFLIAWARPSGFDYANAKVLRVPRFDLPVLKHFSYFCFFLVSIIAVLFWRPSKTFFFPLAPPSFRTQIHALFLYSVSRDFVEVIYQSPRPSRLFRFLSPFKLAFASSAAFSLFKKQGLNVEKFPLFLRKPRKKYDAIALRRKYGFRKSDFVVLHVGHNTKGRGINVLVALARKNPSLKFLLVLSSRVPSVLDGPSNLVVINRYVEDIFEVYALCDVYLFPLKNRSSSIDVPLSVKEAMLFGKPVILPSHLCHLKEEFASYEHLYFLDVKGDFLSSFRDIISEVRKKSYKGDIYESCGKSKKLL